MNDLDAIRSYESRMEPEEGNETTTDAVLWAYRNGGLFDHHADKLTECAAEFFDAYADDYAMAVLGGDAKRVAELNRKLVAVMHDRSDDLIGEGLTV